MSMPARMTINGVSIGSDSTIDVIDPATATVWAVAPDCSAAQLDAAFAAASDSQSKWAVDDAARVAGLHSAAEALRRHEDELSELLTMEQGKTRVDARMEIQIAAMWLDGFADMHVPEAGDTYELPGFVVSSQRRPLGVVAAISPWNFPVALSCYKIGPGLRSGNTMVLKPSPYTPITVLRMGELFSEVLPAGVLNVVSGGDALGALMTSHPVPAKVTLTGSVATGKKVARSAADDLKRVTLELGGNDPAIVLDDADVDKIADRLFASSFMNSGQVCSCVKRIYVPEALHDGLAAAMSGIARRTKVGPGMDAESDLGPVNNEAQYQRVLEMLDAALAEGAEALTGGKGAVGPGYFIEPTILVKVDPSSRIIHEEQFGPVLPLIPYTDLDRVIEEVNSSKYGLGASVWSTDVQKASGIAKKLDTGASFVNNHPMVSPGIPFTGARWSGIGVENGLEGLYEYMQLQVIYEPS